MENTINNELTYAVIRNGVDVDNRTELVYTGQNKSKAYGFKVDSSCIELRLQVWYADMKIEEYVMPWILAEQKDKNSYQWIQSFNKEEEVLNGLELNEVEREELEKEKRILNELRAKQGYPYFTKP